MEDLGLVGVQVNALERFCALSWLWIDGDMLHEIVSVSLFLIGCVLKQIAFVKEAASIIWALQNFVSVASPILLACIVFENTPQAQTTKMVKQPTKTAKSDNRIEELTKLKDLLDVGAITQEEFDAKKKQLLNL